MIGCRPARAARRRAVVACIYIYEAYPPLPGAWAGRSARYSCADDDDEWTIGVLFEAWIEFPREIHGRSKHSFPPYFS